MQRPRTARFLLPALIPVLLTGSACSNGPTGPGGTGWTLETIAVGPRLGYHSSVTVAEDGTVHAAYHDAHNLRLFHARRAVPGGWISTPIDTVGWMGEGVQIAAGAGDTLHLVYKDIFPDDLKYARFAGGEWQYERFDIYQSGGEDPHLFLAPDGIHVLELNEERSAVNYWRNTAGEWENLAYLSFGTSRTSFAFCQGPAGPEVAIFAKRTSWRSSSWQIEHRRAETPGGTWVRSTLLEGLKTEDFYHLSLAMGYDLSDHRHVLYRNGNGRLIDLALGRAIDSQVPKSRVAISHDDAGTLWILYARESSLVLAAYSEPAARWERRAVLGNIAPAGRWGFAIDPGGAVHATVYSSSGRLWYARWEDPE